MKCVSCSTSSRKVVMANTQSGRDLRCVCAGCGASVLLIDAWDGLILHAPSRVVIPASMVGPQERGRPANLLEAIRLGGAK